METFTPFDFCYSLGLMVFAANTGLILALEMRGRYDGYPGQGAELLEAEIKFIKELFSPKKPKK